MGTDSSLTVRIAGGSHRVTVHGEPRDDVSVEGAAETEHDDGDLRIVASGSLTIGVPEGTDVIVASTSGRVTTRGRLGSVRVVGDSGRVIIGRAREVDVRTRSARVEINDIDTECTVRSATGRVEVMRCGGATISTDSGRITVNGSSGPVRAHCISGRITIDMDAAADVVADAVSGRVIVRFPTDVRVGRIEDVTATADAPDEAVDCTVLARSISGRVEVTSR